jgi:hypothetical protein
MECEVSEGEAYGSDEKELCDELMGVESELEKNGRLVLAARVSIVL